LPYGTGRGIGGQREYILSPLPAFAIFIDTANVLRYNSKAHADDTTAYQEGKTAAEGENKGAGVVVLF
jgi:hypothetical protein